MKNDPLWHLVQALSTSEKRQFSLVHKKQKGGYVALYHWYCKQTEPVSPDAAALKSLRLTSGALAVQKNYLSTKLIELMMKNSALNSHTLRVRNLLSQAEVLFQRGLREHASRLESKIQQITSENGMYSHELALYELQEVSIANYKEFNETIDYAGKKRRLIALIEEEIACHELSKKIITLSRKLDYARTKKERSRYEAEFAGDLMNGRKKVRGAQAASYLIHARLHFYNMMQNKTEIRKLYSELVSFWGGNEKLLAQDPMFYIAMSYNLIVNLIAFVADKDRDMLKKHWTELPQKLHPYLTSFLMQRIRFYDAEHKLRIMAQEGEVEKMLGVLPEIQALKQTDHQHTKTFTESIRYFEAMTLFCCGKLKEALKHLLDDLSDDDVTDRRYRIVLRSMLLQLVIHTDLGNMEVTERLASQLARFLKKNNSTNYTEGFLPGFFDACTTASGRNKVKLITDLYNTLLTHIQKNGDWQFFTNQHLLMAWLKKNSAGLNWSQALKHTWEEGRTMFLHYP
ncbi:MAG: hypothetical protein IM638_05020 [Bacteroidetes bacterium]|nr:hypothetical protein [Bacteroidota bacterium]